MKLKIIASLAIVAVVLATSQASAQNSAAVGVASGSAKGNTANSFAGRPTLGYLPTSSGSGVQPIIGVAGASRVDAEIDFGLDLRRVAIAPSRAVALGVRADSGQVVRLSLEGNADPAALDVPANPDRILFSPSGEVAGFYDRESASLLFVDDVSRSPTVGESLSLEGSGLIAGIAVADVVGVSVAAFSSDDVTTIYTLSKAGMRFLTQVRSVADLRFLPNSTGVLVTDSVASQVLLISDADGTATVRVIASAENGIDKPRAAVSRDGRIVFVVTAGAVASLQLDTGEVTSIPCRCSALGFEPIGRDGRYLVTGGLSGAIALLDGREDPSIILVPARDAPTLTFGRRATTRGRAR